MALAALQHLHLSARAFKVKCCKACSITTAGPAHPVSTLAIQTRLHMRLQRLPFNCCCCSLLVQVHEAWQAAGLVPQLHLCQALPGGYSLVMMELLGPDWLALWQLFERPGSSNSSSNYSDADREQCLQAVQGALQHAHSIVVQQGGIKAPAVHGDCRGPNIMVRRMGSSSSSGRVWDVRFVDLDWAGLEGVARYPVRMSDKLPWHPDAKPGCFLHREHDRHLLQKQGKYC